MSVQVKCVKFPVSYIETEEMPYKEFCKCYFDIRRQLWRVKNRVSADFWNRKTQDTKAHEETGQWPQFSKTKWTNEEYHIYKAQLPLYQTANVSQMLKSTVDQIAKHWKEVLSGKRTVDSFKSEQPLVIKGQNLRFESDGNECIAVVSLFSSAIKEMYGVKNGIVRFKMGIKSGSLRAIAYRCLSGEYSWGASTLDYDNRKKKFILSLTYSFNKELSSELDQSKILGVDLGINNAYYAATNFSDYRFFERGGDIEAFRNKTEAIRWKLKKQRGVCGDGSIGHGYKTRMKPVLDVSDKIARYRNHKNHLMSRKIIDEAVSLGCGVIQMEDLSGISSDSKFLKNWSYYDLQQKLSQKAAEKGITVVKINPKYTSQRCNKCGYIDSDNRPKGGEGWEKFKCINCGYETNADYNAARNIATANIENLIKETSANMKQS